MSLANKAISIFKRDLLLFVTNLATGIIVARTLGATALGIWMILSLVSSYAEAFGRVKADAAAVYFIGQKTFRREDVLFNLNLIALASAGFILAVIVWQFDILYDWMLREQTDNYRPHLLMLLTIIPLQFFQLNYSYFHLAEENIVIYNGMKVIHAWSGSIVVIVLLSLTNLGLWAVIYGGIISPLLALIYGWKSVDRRDWVSGRWDWQISWPMIHYGMNFYLSNVLGEFRESGTRLIAISYLAPAQIAFLGQGQGIGRLLYKASDAISTILFPRISRSGSDVAADTACLAFRISSILLLASGAVLAIAAEPLVVFLYGEAFRPTATVVHYLLPGLVISGAASVLANYFYGSGRAKVIPRIQIIPVLLQMLLTWFFLQWWDLAGAALAVSIGLVLYGFALLIVFARSAHVSFTLLYPRLSDVKYILSFGMMEALRAGKRLFRV